MRKASVLRFCLSGIAVTFLLSAVAEAAGPFQFFSVTPCRVVDTRNPTVPDGTGGPVLGANQTRNIPIAGRCGVPTTARAAALNLTVTEGTSRGHLTIWPYNTSMPVVSTINWEAGEPAIANGAIVPLTADPSFSVSVNAGFGTGTTHFLVDVTGYFQ